jgi:hypothetical protein
MAVGNLLERAVMIAHDGALGGFGISPVVVALTDPPIVLFLEGDDGLPGLLVEALLGDVDWLSIREVAADIECIACEHGVKVSTRLRPVRDRAGVIIDLEEMAPTPIVESAMVGRPSS